MQIETKRRCYFLHVNCKNHICGLQYCKHSGLYNNFNCCSIATKWQRQPRDSHLWTNAKSMFRVYNK